MSRLPAWRVPPGSILHWREWDQEYVLFHEQSGDTHRLNQLAADVIRLLGERAMTATDLVAGFSAPVLDAEPVVSKSTIDELLVRLSELGLVEPHNDAAADPGAPGPR